MPDTPFISMIRAGLAGLEGPFGLTTVVRVANWQAGDELETILHSLVPKSRTDDGNLAYDANRDLIDPNSFVFYDRWQTLKALAAHEQSAHFRAHIARMNALFSSQPEFTLFRVIE